MKEAMTLPQACQWIGQKTGKTPATSTAWRWVLRGVRGGIRLESFCIGGTRYTTPDMVQRFIDRTSNTIAATTATTTSASVEQFGQPDHAARRQEIASAQQRLRDFCAPRRRSRDESLAQPHTLD
jgi:hypothetical protein